MPIKNYFFSKISEPGVHIAIWHMDIWLLILFHGTEGVVNTLHVLRQRKFGISFRKINI